jgi:hypothetical protein
MAGFARGARLGPYELLDAIGAGGMGEVFRASVGPSCLVMEFVEARR